MRRILLFIILLALVGGGVWYFFIRPKAGTTTNPVATAFQSFFPVGTSGNGTGNGAPDGTLPGTTPGNAAGASRFSPVTDRPVAGFSIFSLSHTLTLPNADPKLKPVVSTIVDHYVRYVSRASGYVYEVKNTEPATQVTNIFIPNIYEASFADNNTTAILRFLRPNNQTVATYSVPIPVPNPDGTRTQKAGVFFPDNISSLAVSPDTKQVARLTADQNGALVSITNTANTAKKDLIRSPFQEWLVSWPVQSTAYVQTKAAASANGYLYRIDSAAGRLRRIIGDVAGLTTSISPTGNYILYSESTGSGFTSNIFNAKTGGATSLSLAVLPEKCAWYKNDDLLCAGSNSVPEGVYPDAWYAGLMHFQDQLYRISPDTNTYTVVYNGSDRTFDMTNLTLDEGQNLLYFIDKTTGLLWKATL